MSVAYGWLLIIIIYSMILSVIVGQSSIHDVYLAPRIEISMQSCGILFQNVLNTLTKSHSYCIEIALTNKLCLVIYTRQLWAILRTTHHPPNYFSVTAFRLRPYGLLWRWYLFLVEGYHQLIWYTFPLELTFLSQKGNQGSKSLCSNRSVRSREVVCL